MKYISHIIFLNKIIDDRYKLIGCFQDRHDRALDTLEGTIELLQDNYKTRENPIRKCFLAAISKGFRMFAVQNGGQCFSSSNAEETYDKYGESFKCITYGSKNGTGGPLANSVYQIFEGGELEIN